MRDTHRERDRHLLNILLQFPHSLLLAFGCTMSVTFCFMGSAELLTFLNYSQWSMCVPILPSPVPFRMHKHTQRHAHQLNKSPMSIGGKQLSTGLCALLVYFVLSMFRTPSVILMHVSEKKNSVLLFSFSILLSYCYFDDDFLWWYERCSFIWPCDGS